MANEVNQANLNPAVNEQSVLIKTLTGKTIAISYSPDMKISAIKDEIYRQEQIPVEQQRLIYSGKQLDDDKTLGELQVPAGATVHLVLRLRGG